MLKLHCAFDVKEANADGTIAGYGSIFGNIDAASEIVMPGAFKRSLGAWKAKDRTPPMLWMHDPSQPVGKWTSIGEDETGLYLEGRLAVQTQKGLEAYELLKMQALSGLSIGYRVVSSRIDAKRKVRVLTDLDLMEVSLVTFPANDAARVSGVKAAERIKTIRDFEDHLRDAGFSSNAARSIARGGFKAATDSRDETDAVNDLAAALRRNLAILQPEKL